MPSLLERYIDTDFDSYEDFFKNYSVRVPEHFNFAYDIVDEWARIAPDKRAMVWCNDHGQEKTFTFSDMKRLSDRAANVFRSMGIAKGDTVLLILKRRYHFWYCALGLSKLGAVTVPASHLLTQKDIVYRNNAAGIKMIIAVDDEDIVSSIRASLPESPTVEHVLITGKPQPDFARLEEEMEKASEDFVPLTGESRPDNDDPFLFYFTSGTTGMPKIAMHKFTYPLGHIYTAKFWHLCEDGDLHVTVADTGWAKCGWGKMFGQWFVGAAQFIYDMDKFDPRKLAEKITKYRVNSFCAPPTIYRFLIREDLSDLDFSALKYCTTAGEPLNPEVMRQFKELTGIIIREGYGQSETTPIIATFPWVEPVLGSLGKPAPGYHISLLDDTGTPCETGDVGEIVINTDINTPVGLFCGYFRNEAATKEVWYAGQYHTGDTAWVDEDGYYWFVGRTDDLIKSSGYRIGPFEVESALIEHPAVLECAISAVPDPVRGNLVKATVVLTRGYSPSDALVKELQEHVKNVTAPYKYPRIIEFVDELPKTVSGKIKRKEIRERDARQERDTVSRT